MGAVTNVHRSQLLKTLCSSVTSARERKEAGRKTIERELWEVAVRNLGDGARRGETGPVGGRRGPGRSRREGQSPRPPPWLAHPGRGRESGG